MKFLGPIDGASKLVTDSNNRLTTDAKISEWNGKAEVSAIPTKVSQIENDAGYLTNGLRWIDLMGPEGGV